MPSKFQPTEKQIERWNQIKTPVMPSDDEFKAQWKKSHHGKEAGWGMEKRDWVANHANDHLTYTVEYNIGLWQGRVDAMNGDAAIETNNYHTDPYQNGYYSGYNNFASFWKGFDRNARADFQSKFGTN